MTGGEIKHFLSINNLSIGVINSILDRADSFFPIGSKSVKKIPILRGKTIANLFFEPSTRTKTTFELAATRLSADTLNINIESNNFCSPLLLDTCRTCRKTLIVTS